MVKCPKCGGESFKSRRKGLDNYGLRSADFIVCEGCDTAMGAMATSDEIDDLQTAMRDLKRQIEELQEKLGSK